MKIGSLLSIVKHPNELYLMVKLFSRMMSMEKQIRVKPSHLQFCYNILRKVARGYYAFIQVFDADLRDVVCVFSLVLRALDTIEDDTNVATEVKVPILKAFYSHVHDSNWHFSCGTNNDKLLMDNFHHVSTAFLELDHRYQEVIEDVTMKMGAGMAKFICNEVETLDDLDEYCHYVCGLVLIGMVKISHACRKEELPPDHLLNATGLFVQKADIIQDFLEDINQVPKPRIFWPRQIWSKYANKLEDLTYEENSVQALQCLNDMITNALVHVEGCLKYVSTLQDPVNFRPWAIPPVLAMGLLALCYNNIQVFRSGMEMRPGLLAKIVDGINTISDVYGAFYDFSLILKSKIDENDPNAEMTRDRVDAILKLCRDSGTLNQRKLYIVECNSQHKATLVFGVLAMLAILLAHLSATALPSIHGIRGDM